MPRLAEPILRSVLVTALLWTATLGAAALDETGVPLVTGRVLDAAGQPLPDITVTLLPVLGLYEQSFLEQRRQSRPPAAILTTTDIEGRFEVRAPDFGMWRIEAGGNGREVRTWPLFALTGPVHLPPARLRPVRTLDVRLRDGEGSVPRDAIVLVSAQGADARAWQPAPNGGWLDDSGNLLLEVTPAQPLELRAWAPGYLEIITRLSADTSTYVQLLERGRPLPLTVTRRVSAWDASPDVGLPDLGPPDLGPPDLGEPAAGVAIRSGRTGWLSGHTNLGGRAIATAQTDATTPLWLQAEDDAALSVPLPPLPPGEPASPLPLQLRPPWQLDGHLVEADSGLAIGDAWIWYEDDPGAAVRSNQDGSFQLRVPESGHSDRRIHAAAVGYTPLVTVLREPIAPWTLELERSLTLQGRVVDSHGSPVAGADVYALDPELRHPLTYAETRIDGHFELPALAARSRYRLYASHGQHSAVETEVDTSNWPPDLVLELPPARHVHGRTVDPEGQPLAGVEVTLFTPQPRLTGSDHFRVASDTDGRFELLDIPDGEYQVRATLADHLPAVRNGVHLGALGASKDGRQDVGTLILHPATNLFGRVTTEDNRPVAEAQILVLDESDGDERARAYSGSGGEYEILRLPMPRRVSLELVRDGFLPARFTGISLPHDGALDLRMLPESQFSGTVVDLRGQALSGAALTLVAASTETPAAQLRRDYVRQPPEQTSDAEGRFRFLNLLPGAYQLQVRLRGYQNFAGQVRLSPGEQRDDVRIPLQPGAVLEGRVLSTNGQSIESAELRAFPGQPGTSASDNSLLTFSGPDGGYRFDQLPVNSVTVVVQHPAYPPLSEIIELQGEFETHDLILEDPLYISGTVVLPDGSPAIGANVLATNLRLDRGTQSEAPDGRFRIDALGEGSYELVASLPGFPLARLQDPVELNGGPEEGLLLRLSAGTTVRGRIFGLQPDELSSLRIQARSGALQAEGRVETDGSYAVEGLTTGTWHILAQQTEDGRVARDEIDLFEGDDKRLDLTFPIAHRVTGRVLYRGTAVPDARVALLGTNTFTTTDYLGQFHLPKVPEGRQALTVFAPARGLEHREELQVDRDLEVELVLASQQVVGRVLDAATGEPLRGTRVYLQWSGDPASLWNQVRPGTQTDDAGYFRITGVPAGAWDAIVWHHLYLPEIQPIEVRHGSDLSGLMFQMQLPAQQ